MADPVYLAFMGRGEDRVLHWENFSNPDAATHISGIDYYQQPRTCILKVNEMYPFLRLRAPAKDTPIPRPEEQEDTGKGRWGAHFRDHWQQGEAGKRFSSHEEMLKFSPLEQGDFTGWHIMADGDYSSEEIIYERLRKAYPPEWEDQGPKGTFNWTGFYNTMFMWPLVLFGYENFMYLCLEPEFERIMDEFAELSRRVFKAIARLPVNFVWCHDDIVLANGPVVSPQWMHKYIFPRYEEFWGLLRAAGKEVVFVADGCMDAFADDVMACGARGMHTEPFTDFRAIARKHKDCVLAGEGDCRILMSNDKPAIRKMVEKMVETSKMSRGYLMGIGNHIPFNVPPEMVKYYFDLSAELGHR